jgi:hypothetical protein
METSMDTTPPLPTKPRIERLGLPPYDEPMAALLLRFGVQVVAWMAIQQVWGWGAMVAAIVVLALFPARGTVPPRGIAVAGALRVTLELLFMGIGAYASALWFAPIVGVGMGVAILCQIVVGWRRYQWLMRQ